MKLFVIFAVALVGAVHAGYIKNGDHSGHDSTGHGGYVSIGSSGLRTIAQGSADQANSAVAEQHSAARQAAFIAKNTLAQAAAQASATAQAALTGKAVLLRTLEQVVAIFRQFFSASTGQLEITQEAAAAAAAAVQKAQAHYDSVKSVWISAQGVQEQAQQAANSAAGELASQESMVEKAKARLQALEAQLEAIQADFAATQEAAEKASLAAQAAQNNAQAAGAHAILELEHSANSGNDVEDEDYSHLIDVKSKYSH